MTLIELLVKVRREHIFSSSTSSAISPVFDRDGSRYAILKETLKILAGNSVARVLNVSLYQCQGIQAQSFLQHRSDSIRKAGGQEDVVFKLGIRLLCSNTFGTHVSATHRTHFEIPCHPSLQSTT